MSDFTFHHLGVACESIEADKATWLSLGYRLENAPFVDEAQGIRGLFMVGGGPRVELLEGLEGSMTLAPWIKRRVKFYHVGYLVQSLDAAMEKLLTSGATIARSPMMSVYFQSRIAFLMMPNLALIEIIDGQGKANASGFGSSA